MKSIAVLVTVLALATSAYAGESRKCAPAPIIQENTYNSYTTNVSSENANVVKGGLFFDFYKSVYENQKVKAEVGIKTKYLTPGQRDVSHTGAGEVLIGMAIHA